MKDEVIYRNVVFRLFRKGGSFYFLKGWELIKMGGDLLLTVEK
jgi:hypothetical protein